MHWCTTILFLLLAACNGPSAKPYSSPRHTPGNKKAYKVVGVKDGDTFVLLMNGKEQVVRLAHIDCPEKKQPFGNKAKQFAAGLCFGRMRTRWLPGTGAAGNRY